MKKIKVNINRAPVSKEEIESKRNFEQVLKQVMAYSKPFYQTNLFLNSVLVILFATVVGYTVVKLNEQVEKEKESVTVGYVEAASIIKAVDSTSTEIGSVTREINSVVREAGSIDSLQTQEFVVRIDRDTVLYTAEGAVVKIPAGTLQSPNKKIVLQLKEAYTMEDMIRAGLTTKAGKELLSSGGMFYIQAKDNAYVKIAKPLAIDIPTAEVDAEMQLFTGQTTAAGKIDWQNPVALKKETVKSSQVLEGESLFNKNCISCHRLGKDAVGPDLAYIGQRRDFEWLVRYIQSSSVMIAGACGNQKSIINKKHDAFETENGKTFGQDYTASAAAKVAVDYSNDAYAVCLLNAYNKSVMPSIPLSKNEIRAISQYCKDESERLKLPYPKDELYINFQKCKTYKALMTDLNAQKQALKNKREWITKNEYTQFSRTTDRSMRVLQLPNNAVSLSNRERKSLISGGYVKSEYYQVEINTFGWFNIDRLTKNIPGLVASNLMVNVPAAFIHTFHIYLVLPEMKVHAIGGLLKESNEAYGFYEDNGNIMLPQGKTAHVYLTGEKDGQLLYAAATFVTDKVNKLSLSPAAISNEAFNAKIKALINTEGIEIKAADSKNAAALREMDAQLITLNEKIKQAESMKPANCDCGCNEEGEKVKADTTYVSKGKQQFKF